MNRIPFLAFVLSLIVFSCNNDQTTGSPYGDMLEQPPYNTITDSIRRSPKDDELYFRRAVLLNQNNLPEPALADFRKAWSIKQQEKYASGIGYLLLEKQADSALQFLDAAIKVLPQSILLRITRARAFDDRGMTDEAIAACDEILLMNPQQVDVMILKANLLGKKGEEPSSTQLLEKAYSLTPYDLDLNHTLALQYAESKNPKVLQLCDSLIKMDSLKIHADPYYYKGIYYSNTGQSQAAIAQFDAAITHDYSFKEAYIEKGATLYDLHKYAEAYKVFNLLMSISVSYGPAYYWMAKCQEALGDKDEASLNYQRAYGLDKTDTAAKNAADRLRK
jgi:tetratricopeptide (TPR) repeat protein